MRVTRFCCLAVLLLIFKIPSETLAQSSSQAQLQSFFQQGAAQMHAGDAAAAEKTFRKATELDPQFAPAHLDLGLAQLKQGKLLDAIASIRRSLEIGPSSPGAHLFLGIAEYQSSHAEEAITDLESAVKEDPKNTQALTWLGIVRLNTGHPEAATGPFDRAAELAPSDENILDYRVQAHMAVARQSYTALYNADPTSWRLHRLNAAIDAQASDHVHAAEEYKQAIKLAPTEPETLRRARLGISPARTCRSCSEGICRTIEAGPGQSDRYVQFRQRRGGQRAGIGRRSASNRSGQNIQPALWSRLLSRPRAGRAG